MLDTTSQGVSTVLFAGAVIHTFLTGWFNRLAEQHPEGSLKENLFHFLGEIEVVFGIWAAIFCGFLAWHTDFTNAIHFVEGLSFTEPVFVFAIMAVAATRPVLAAASSFLGGMARMVPLPGMMAECLVLLSAGSLLGSLITEPAAMTVTALLFRDRVLGTQISNKLRYAILGTLFVNVSIGGVLTPFAAPPVVMVAGKWGWDTAHMISHFGWRAAVAVVINAAALTIAFRRELGALCPPGNGNAKKTNHAPLALVFIHLAFLTAIVAVAHHIVAVVGVFMMFLGVVQITGEYQDRLQVRESLLVAFFLAGLVVLGAGQHWWLRPLLAEANVSMMFWGTTGLTAITDNAALTYLAAQVPDLGDAAKYAVVAGAVTGGGLTVIANAPNPAGYSILRDSFPDGGIKPLSLFVAALLPTAVAAILLMP